MQTSHSVPGLDAPRPLSELDDMTALLASILEGSTEYAIMAISSDGTILSWNEGARRLYGRYAAEIVGTTTLLDLCHREEVQEEQVTEILKESARTGRWVGELKQVRKETTPFAASITVTPRRDPTGSPLGFTVIARDLSDHGVLSRQELQAQEYDLSFTESNTDAVMTTDTLGYITDVNRQMRQLTGLSRERLIGTPIKLYFTDPARAENAIRETLREGRISNYELTAVAVDGKCTVVSYNTSILHDSLGRLKGVFAAARDITDQKFLEQQLREAQAYTRGLIEASVDGLITVSPDGHISDVNEQMCRMTGYSREDLIGTAFVDYFVETERATEGMTTTFKNGTLTDYHLTLSTRDNLQIHVSLNSSVYRDSSGQIRGISFTARDVTAGARLKAEAAALSATARGQIEACPDGLIVVDPMMKITGANETMCRMSGLAASELIGSDFPSHFTDPKRVAEEVRRALGGTAVSDLELTMLCKDGSSCMVAFSAATFQHDLGLIRRIFASVRDVTAQSKFRIEQIELRAYTRGLIEASVDGLVTVDDQMVITDVNETMCRMLGRPRRLIMGSTFPGYFSDQQAAKDLVRRTFREEAVSDCILDLQGTTGRTMPISVNTSTLKDTSGKVRGIVASARDITAQQALEGQVQALQFYTRLLFESNVDALVTTDPIGIITDVNQQMETLTGRTRERLVGSQFRDYFTEPVLAEDAIRRVLREKRVNGYALTACSTSGKQTVVSCNAVTFSDAAGNLQGVFAAARDVTDSQQLEKQLREQQSHLRGLIESSVDGLITIAPTGSITDVNEQLCRMTGCVRDDLIGTPLSDYFTEPERAAAAVQTTLDTGTLTEYALTIVARSRRQLQVSLNASVFRDPAGEVQGIYASARDVTAQVRLEEQLREQQRYLRGLIECAGDGLIMVDPEGFITDVNAAMCRMTDCARDDLVGSIFKAYFTQPERADQGVKRTFAEGELTNFELVMKNGSGRKSTVSLNTSIFRTGDGRIQGMLASARDISEQARLKTLHIEQQAYNQSLIGASPDAQFALSPDGIIFDVNEEATRLTGYPRKHLIDSRFAQYFTDLEKARTAVEQTLAARRVIGYELILITRSGRRTTVSFNSGMLTDALGAPLGILATARDIDAQKQLEQRLRDAQLYTRSLIESNIDAIMTTDSIGIITDVNHEMEELTGCSRTELIGSAFNKYFTDPARADEAIREVLREGRVTNYELTARAVDGRQTVVSYNAVTLLNQGGKLQGVFAAARDITERKLFESTLQEKNNELENASLTKDRFLASMSHELRTPLNAIIGFTGTLLMKLPGPLTLAQDKQLRTIQTSARHQLSLINELLDLAKIESGKVDFLYEPVSCAALAQEVANGLRPLAEDKGLHFAVDSPVEDLVITTDRRAVLQILINLCNNAIKFTEKGEVKLSVGRPPGADAAGVSMTVSDTGIGIKPDDQVRLFQAFAQLATARSQRTEGTGLGLHLSQKLAGLLGGSIVFESQFGIGSKFTLLMERV